MFICEQCSKDFNHHRNLRRHIKLIHGIHNKLPSLKEEPEELFACTHCSKKYRTKRLLAIHNKKEHLDLNFSNNKNLSKNICPLHCGFSSFGKSEILTHLQINHEIVVETENLTFLSYEAFINWKDKTECETKSKFVTSRSKGKTKFMTTHYFSCHRSGHFQTESKGVRHLKVNGSNKINAVCPASIKVQEKSNGQCDVTFTKTHAGLKEDLGHLFLRNEDRDALAVKIAARVPYEAILNELRESICGTLDRIHLVTRKDLHNIEMSFNLFSSERRHQDDGTSVQAWVEEMQNMNDSCILFYKPQGYVSDIYNFLKQEDFILIVMNRGQEDVLKRYGHNIICMDGTHGLNNYDFELLTVLTIDDLHQGFPCAFMFTNRSDEPVIKIMAEKIKERVGNLKPNMFMSDMAESFFNGWSQIMGMPVKRLYCTWHVIKAWRHNLREKIKNPEKREMVYNLIATLMQETDSTTFNVLKDKGLNRIMADKETEAFGKYFQDNYLKCEQYWAFSFRLWAQVNTNMHLEALHKTLKYFYLSGIKVKRLDKGIHAMMRFIRDKLFDRLITMEKGKVTSKLKLLRSRHKKSLEMNMECVVRGEDEFIVQSESDPTEIYTVRKVENISCTKCLLKCTECQSCIHAYNCTCIDNSIRWNMCKHIHLVCSSLLLRPTRSEENIGEEGDPKLGLPQESLVIDEEIILTQNEPEMLVNTLSAKISNTIGVGTNLESRKIKTLKTFEDLLTSATTIRDIDAIDSIIAQIKPTLTAINANIGLFSDVDKKVPANKKISIQKRLFSTKKPCKKSKKSCRPNINNAEKKKMALSLLLEENDLSINLSS